MTAPEDLLDTPAAGGLVVRGGAVRAVGFAVATVVSLGAVVLLTRHLGVARYGRYQTVVSIIAIVQIVADAGLGTLGLRELSHRRDDDARTFLAALLGLRIVLTSVAVLVAAVVLLVAGEAELAAGVGLMGTGLLIALLQATYALPLAVQLRLVLTTVLETGRQVLYAATLAVLVVAGAGLVPLFTATIPAALVVLAWTVGAAGGGSSVRPVFARPALAAVLRPALPVALATTAGVTYLYAVQLVTAAVASPHDSGVFAIAFRVFVVAASAPAVLVTTAFPVLARAAARDDGERFVGAVGQLVRAMLLLGVGVAVVTVTGARPIIDLAGGADFAAAADVLRIQGGVLVLTFLLPVLGFALLARERHRALLIANVCGLLTMLIATALLVDAHGATGAAWAQLAGETVMLVGYVVSLGARPGVAVRTVVPAVARVAAAAGLALAVGLGALASAPDASAAAAAGATYALAAIALGALPPGVRELLRRGAV